MHTRGLEANGSRITIAGTDKAQIVGSAYGLGENMLPTPEALANSRLWAGSAKLLDACRAVDADIERDGAVSAGTIEAVRAAIKDATIPAQGGVTLPVTMAEVAE